MVIFALSLLLIASPPGSTWVKLDHQGERVVTVVDNVSIDAWRVDLRHWRASVRRAPVGGARVAAMVAGDAVVIASNASFFDTAKNAMGIVVADDGKTGVLKQNFATLVVKGPEASVLAPGVMPPDDATLVLQGLPRLVVDGKVVPGLVSQRARRTAVCADGHRLTLVIADGAVDAVAFARHLVTALKCRQAINLDGGPSTQLVARVGGDTATVTGGWGVPNVLVLTPKGS